MPNLPPIKTKTGRLQILRLLIVTVLLCSGSAVAESKPLTLGIHPYQSPQKLLKIYQPLATLLEERIHRPIKIVIAKDYAAHIKLTGNDQLDIAYMGPASYVIMTREYGKKRILARQAINHSPTFQGKIIARADSKLNSLADLANKTFAFGDPESTMSHLVPRFMLIRAGLTADKLKKIDFLGSHDNVALGVLSGDYDAGAVKEAILYKYQSRGLKALATTPALSEHLLVASNNLPAALVEKIRQVLFDLKNDTAGQEAMTSIKKHMTEMVPASDADYDNLREILDTLRSRKIIK